MEPADAPLTPTPLPEGEGWGCTPTPLPGVGERGRGEGDAGPEDLLPIEVAWLEQSAGLVGPVVEHHRSAYPVTAIAVNGGDIGTANAVVFEPFVKRCHAGFADARLHQVAETVVDHGR